MDWNITLRAKLSGAVYCYRSCLWLWCLQGRVGSVCYHDNSKLRASIFTKLGLYVQVVTISSWLNFGGPAPPGRGSAAWRKFLAPLTTASAQCFLSERFFISYEAEEKLQMEAQPAQRASDRIRLAPTSSALAYDSLFRRQRKRQRTL